LIKKKDIYSTQNDNYKVIRNSEINKEKHSNTAPIFEYEKLDTNVKYPCLDKIDYARSSLLYNTLFNIIKFNNTKIRQKLSKSTVLIYNILPLSSESQTVTVLLVYGKVNHIEIIIDPVTRVPLGSANVQFDNLPSAHCAINHDNGKIIMISDAIKIEFDSTSKD
jgi:hypothetical protein